MSAEPENALHHALQLHQAGRTTRAEAAYRAILAGEPGNADALHLLAVLCLQANRASEGLTLAQRAVAENGRSPAYRNTLGLAQRAGGDTAAAEASFQAALALEPRHAEAHLNLGNLCRDAGEATAAEAHYRQAIAITPNYAAAHSNLGNLLSRLKRHDEAIRHLEQAATLAPRDPGILNNLAGALRMAGGRMEAVARFREALALQPNYAAALSGLGSLLAQSEEPGDAEEAVALLERALALDPSIVDVRVNLANALGTLGRHHDALATWQILVAGRPDKGRYRIKLGDTLQALGRFEDARAVYDEALRHDPASADALAAIATLDRAHLIPEYRGRMLDLLARPDLALKDRGRLDFALAKVLDAEGDYDAAFAHLRRANDARREERSTAGWALDEERFRSHCLRAAATFTPDLFARMAPGGSASDLPIFVVGMPRSGTTLTEQILASHPRVHGAGEMTHIAEIAHRILPDLLLPRGRLVYPDYLSGTGIAALRQVASGYLDRVRALAPAAERITDKLPNNFLHVGLIAALFPNAQIVHCRRNPLDTCLSCYEQDFSGKMLFSWELGELGRYYQQYDRLMAHWRQVLPRPMIEVRYERLVADLPTEARRLVAQCSLDWDDACLAFHETDRPVLTASLSQVRRPIYASSVGKWRRYKKHLSPLIEALGELAADDIAI